MSSPGGGKGNCSADAEPTAQSAARDRQQETTERRDNIRKILRRTTGRKKLIVHGCQRVRQRACDRAQAFTARNAAPARSAVCHASAIRGWLGTGGTVAGLERSSGRPRTNAVVRAIKSRKACDRSSRPTPIDARPDAPELPGRRTGPAARQARSVGN